MVLEEGDLGMSWSSLGKVFLFMMQAITLLCNWRVQRQAFTLIL